MTVLAGYTDATTGSSETLNPKRGKADSGTPVLADGTVNSATLLVAGTNGSVQARVVVYRQSDQALLGVSEKVTPSTTGEVTVNFPVPFAVAENEFLRIYALADNYFGIGINADTGVSRREWTTAVVDIDTIPDPEPANSGSTKAGHLGIYLSGDAASTGPSITTADDITDESQPATFTLSGNENAPTGVTINGEAGSNITFVSEDTGAGTETYSYEPPLIADDDTADLVVSVDGTTAGATIAYANSYDRDQLTHPATEAEYSENSLSYPNAYATTQPYEWKVISGANASVVTIDWNALEADDGFHKDVASYAAPVANGSTTVTLGVFVPETGQAYQFDRTIRVSDGSVVVVDKQKRRRRQMYAAYSYGVWKNRFMPDSEDK